MCVKPIFEYGSKIILDYRDILSEKREINLFLNSIFIASGTTFFSLLIGVPLAFFIAKTDIYLRNYLKYVYLISFLIPSYITSIAWIDLLGNNGLLNRFLLSLHLIENPLFSIYSLSGTIFILSLSYFPLVILLCMSGLLSINRSMEESARLSNNEFGMVTKINIPLIIPHIFSSAIFVFIFALSNYGVPSLLGVNTYPVEIFAQFSAYYNNEMAVVLSLPILLISLILIIFQYLLMRNKSYITVTGTWDQTYKIKLGKFRYPISFIVLFIIFISGLLPLLILLIRSGGFLAYKSAIVSGYKDIFNSLVWAILGASFIVIIGLPISEIIHRSKGFGKKFLDIISFLPFAVPSTIFGIGIIMVWNKPVFEFIYTSFIIVIFVYIAQFVPFSIRIILSNLKQVDKSLMEASLLTLNGWFKRFVKISFPLLKPGLLTSWIVAFIFCMEELGASLLVIPAGKSTLPIRIYTLMHYGAGKIVSALGIIFVLLCILPICFVTILSKGGQYVK